MKKIKLIMTFCFAVVLSIALGVTASACGENLQWELNAEGRLLIYGEGDMYNYGPAPVLSPVRDNRGNFIPPGDGIDDTPWEYYEDEITTIVIEEGVTSIGQYAFSNLHNLYDVKIPSTVKTIGSLAFFECNNLEEIKITEGVEKIYVGAFLSCDNLKTITIPQSILSIDEKAFDSCPGLEKIIYLSTEENWNNVFADGESPDLENVEIVYIDEYEEDFTEKQIVLTIGEKTATVFGEEKTNDVAPKIANDRTMLPARFVAENLGAEVIWTAQEPNKITVEKGETQIVIYVGSNEAFVNGKSVELDSPAFVENDRTYTPVRFIVENLGAEAAWDNETRSVIITVE